MPTDSDKFRVHGKLFASSPLIALDGEYDEAAEAADFIEDYLSGAGIPNEAYCEIRFNGDADPHTMVFLLDHELFGVWNTPSARWPIFYPDGSSGGRMLDGMPDEYAPEDALDDPEDGFGDEDEDSKLMDLSGGAEDDDSDDETEDDDSDDLEEDDEADDEFKEDDEAEDEISSDDGDEDETEDDEEEDFTEDDEGDDEDEDENESEDEDEEDESDDETDDETDDEEEVEMPRLKIFAKMRGPKGWRKRAEAEELMERNSFALKIGVLDEDEELTPAKQEREVVAHIEFRETDDDRAAGLLRMKLPEGITLDDFTQTKSGWITARVPYRAGE